MILFSVDSLEGRNGLNLVIERLMDYITVRDVSVLVGSLLESERMLHPVHIVSLRVVISSVSTARLLSVLGGINGHLALNEKVLELESLNEVGVPHLTAIRQLDVFVHLRDLVHLLAALLEQVLLTEDGGVTLHGLLESTADLGGRVLAVGEAHSVELGNGLFTGVRSELLLGLTRHEVLDGGLGGTSTEDDEIEQRVGAESVSTMDGSAGGFTASSKAGHNDIVALGVGGEHLSLPVRRDTTHVVVHSRQDRNGLLGSIDTGENVSRLNDTRKSLEESLRGQMVQVKMDVISLRSDTSTLENLHGHRTRDDISGGKILGSGSISLHESLTIAVSQDATFASAALGHEAASAVDTRGVELDELGVLNRKASSSNHATTVTSAGVSGRAREIGSTVATSSNDSVVRLHSVNGTVGHIVAHDTAALASLHDEVESKVLNEEDAVVAERPTKQSVQHAVAGSVGDGAASIGLTTLAEVLRLTTEGSLIDLAVLRSRERHAV